MLTLRRSFLQRKRRDCSASTERLCIDIQSLAIFIAQFKSVTIDQDTADWRYSDIGELNISRYNN